MRSHKVDDLWGDFFSSTNKIAFIFSILIIDYNDYLSVFDRLNGIFNGVKRIFFHRYVFLKALFASKVSWFE